MDLCNPNSKDTNALQIPPISRLPTELLIELFATCAVNEAASGIAPLTLSSVCHLWKEVVYSSPRVWQLVSLNDHERPITSSLKQAELWLARSAPLPFDVELNLQSSDSLLSLMSPSLPFLDRWRYFWISGEREESIDVSDLFRPGLIPVLHYLNVIVQLAEESGQPETRDSPTLYACGGEYSQTPQHISMNISLAELPPADKLVPLQFTALNITEVTLEVFLQPSQLLNFLVACPLLEQLFFSGGVHNELESDNDSPPPVADLIHLRTLLIRNTCFQRTLLSHMYTPSLRELYLQNLNLEFALTEYGDIEDGDSDDEPSDYSQSPYSDHHTGASDRVGIFDKLY